MLARDFYGGQAKFWKIQIGNWRRFVFVSWVVVGELQGEYICRQASLREGHLAMLCKNIESEDPTVRILDSFAPFCNLFGDIQKLHILHISCKHGGGGDL